MSNYSVDPFSTRFGYSSAPESRIHEAAPESVRVTLVGVVGNGLTPSAMREIVCESLRRFPNTSSNWGYNEVLGEVRELVDGAPWYKVYDICEQVYRRLANPLYFDGADGAPERFSEEMNRCFLEEGIGWKLVDGKIEARGSDAFESALKGASEELTRAGRVTGASEMQLALGALSRRPEADVTGAIQHALAALECVARDVGGNPKATLGDLIKQKRITLPAPLDEAVSKLWGFASEWGRHLREGRQPTRHEAELLVGIAASVATYLSAVSEPRNLGTPPDRPSLLA